MPKIKIKTEIPKESSSIKVRLLHVTLKIRAVTTNLQSEKIAPAICTADYGQMGIPHARR